MGCICIGVRILATHLRFQCFQVYESFFCFCARYRFNALAMAYAKCLHALSPFSKRNGADHSQIGDEDVKICAQIPCLPPFCVGCVPVLTRRVIVICVSGCVAAAGKCQPLCLCGVSRVACASNFSPGVFCRVCACADAARAFWLVFGCSLPCEWLECRRRPSGVRLGGF